MSTENINLVDNLPQDKIMTFIDELDRVSGEHFMLALQTDDMDEVDEISIKLRGFNQMKRRALDRMTL